MTRKFAPAFLSLALLLPVKADLFTLKDGTVLEGKILKENDEDYLLEVQVTKTIRDERTVKKDEVTKIERISADVEAFESLKKLVPTPDLLDETDYAQRIKQVQKFLKKYPDTTFKEEANGLIEALQEELTVVEEGGRKMNGEMVSPEDYQKNAYELDSRAKEMRIRQLVDGNHFLAALREFQLFERDFLPTQAYSDLYPLMIKVMQVYRKQAADLLGTYEARMAKRVENLDRLSPTERGSIERAIRDEDAALERRYQREKNSRATWLTIDPYHRGSLEDAVRSAESESRRLESSAGHRRVENADELYRKTWEAVHNAEDIEALREARNDLNTLRGARMPDRYLKPLMEAAEAAIETQRQKNQ